MATETIKMNDNIYQFFQEAYDKGWTDGLPVIPPIEELVQQFVAYTKKDKDEVIAEVDPRRGVATVEKIAINAVMAGCLPEYMQVLIAMVKASSEPKFNFGGIQATTNPVTPMTIVNGPVRNELQMNAGRNALGPGNRANATIGRAMRLIQLNIGGAIPKEVDKATLGMPGKYTFCFPENEEESPWDPLSVELGFSKGENVVTMVAAQGTNNIFPGLKSIEDTLLVLADCMSAFGNNNFLLGGGNPVIVLPPGHAQSMHKAGYTKSKIKDILFEKSAKELSTLPKNVFPMGELNVINNKVYVCKNPEDLFIVVAGGPEPYHITYVANFGDSTYSAIKIQ